MGCAMSDDQPVSLGPILLAATAAALSARTGRIQPHQVEALTGAAHALPEGHPLRFEVMTFCHAWGQHRRDPEAVSALGEALDRGIARALRKDPIDRNRSDIHG